MQKNLEVTLVYMNKIMGGWFSSIDDSSWRTIAKQLKGNGALLAVDFGETSFNRTRYIVVLITVDKSLEVHQFEYSKDWKFFRKSDTFPRNVKLESLVELMKIEGMRVGAEARLSSYKFPYDTTLAPLYETVQIAHTALTKRFSEFAALASAYKIFESAGFKVAPLDVASKLDKTFAEAIAAEKAIGTEAYENTISQKQQEEEGEYQTMKKRNQARYLENAEKELRYYEKLLRETEGNPYFASSIKDVQEKVAIWKKVYDDALGTI